jgi:nucleoside-diphosphate-sugar epimerase
VNFALHLTLPGILPPSPQPTRIIDFVPTDVYFGDFRPEPAPRAFARLVGPHSGCPRRSNLSSHLLIPFGFDPKAHRPGDAYVLVLGSGGLVGSALAGRLRASGRRVLHVLSRHHHDLRLNGTLDIFGDLNITFVFFLAYEVGGAKFLTVPGLQQQILDFNIRITRNVFDWLERRAIRFAFASSSLTADNSAYGHVKRIGENRTAAAPHLGRVFRLWNAYGFEYPGPKSHAIPDFVFQCLTVGRIDMMTDGMELRQFTHVDDIADALVAIMEHFDEAPLDVDVSDGVWMKMIDVARAVQKSVPECQLNAGTAPAKVQKRHEASLNSTWHQTRWKQVIQFDDGVRQIVEEMRAFISVSKAEPAVSIVIDCGSSFNSEVASDLEYVVTQIDAINRQFSPMTIEIIATAETVAVGETDFPCTTLVGAGRRRDAAVEAAKSKIVLITNPRTLPTASQLSFFQRQIPRDLIFYFADAVHVASRQNAAGETNSTTATFAIVNDCDADYAVPQDLSFIAATKETWLSIGLPPDGVNINDWLMRFSPGYIAVRFESPVWTWGDPPLRVPRDRAACCRGDARQPEAAARDPVLYPGKRPRV